MRASPLHLQGPGSMALTPDLIRANRHEAIKDVSAHKGSRSLTRFVPDRQGRRAAASSRQWMDGLPNLAGQADFYTE